MLTEAPFFVCVDDTSQNTPFVPKHAPLLPSSTPHAQSVMTMTSLCQQVRSRFPSNDAGP